MITYQAGAESALEQAIKKGQAETAEEDGEDLAGLAGLILFNAVSDIEERGRSLGITGERSVACYLKLCRRVDELTEGEILFLN